MRGLQVISRRGKHGGLSRRSPLDILQVLRPFGARRPRPDRLCRAAVMDVFALGHDSHQDNQQAGREEYSSFEASPFGRSHQPAPAFEFIDTLGRAFRNGQPARQAERPGGPREADHFDEGSSDPREIPLHNSRTLAPALRPKRRRTRPDSIVSSTFSRSQPLPSAYGAEDRNARTIGRASPRLRSRSARRRRRASDQRVGNRTFGPRGVQGVQGVRHALPAATRNFWSGDQG